MNIFKNENGHLVYEIESLNDFLKIPADRLQDCLADFKVATDMLRPLHQAAQAVAKNPAIAAAFGIDLDSDKINPEQVEDPVITRKFQWIDDGIHGEAAAKSVRLTGIEPEGDDMIRVQLSTGPFDDEETD